MGGRIRGTTKASGFMQLSVTEQRALGRVSDSVAASPSSPGGFVRLSCFFPSVRVASFGAGLVRVRWRVHRESLFRRPSPSELHSRRLPPHETLGVSAVRVAAASISAPLPLSSRVRAFCTVWLDRNRPLLL